MTIINTRWNEYIKATERLERAEKKVQDALIGLKELGNQFVIEGQTKQVRARKTKDGSDLYYLVNIKGSPRKATATIPHSVMKKIERNIRRQILSELRQDFQGTLAVDGDDDDGTERTSRVA